MVTKDHKRPTRVVKGCKAINASCKKGVIKGEMESTGDTGLLMGHRLLMVAKSFKRLEKDSIVAKRATKDHKGPQRATKGYKGPQRPEKGVQLSQKTSKVHIDQSKK